MARPKKLNHPPTTAKALEETSLPALSPSTVIGGVYSETTIPETPVNSEIVAEPIPEEIIKSDKKLYRSKNFNLYHPFQCRHLTTDVSTELFMDGWLESQINAGLVKEWQS